MREYAGFIGLRILNIVDQFSTRRVQTPSIAYPFCDFMVGTRGVAADSQSADDLAIAVERDAAAEEDQSTADFIGSSAVPVGPREEMSVIGIRLAQAP